MRFNEATKFEELSKFLKNKGLNLQGDIEEISSQLDNIRHEYFEISNEDNLMLLAIYDESDLKSIEKEFKENIFLNYIVLVKNDFSEYKFLKYDEGTGKILKLSKNRDDLNNAFLNKLDLISFNDLISFEKIFDRSELIEDFYNLYCYAEEYLIKNIKGVPEEEEKEYLAKLIIQRIMFLWFLQKKGFLNDNENYFIDEFKQNSNNNFYKNFLNELFFNGLCIKKVEREERVKSLIGDVPYLNGGLFVKSEVELKYEDSIEIRDNGVFYRVMNYPIMEHEKNIPVLNLLECKEWTIDEQSGEVEKLSPEVLGYIFEKSINQKDLGAVYTPTEITTYICRNTIYPYIINKVNEKYNSNYRFINNLELDFLNKLNKNQLEYLFNVIKNLKILDPAVGSGHFLVDAIIILEKLYYFLRNKNIIKCSNFKIREYIVTKNLYGVDILTGAIEICKLRLFLALAESFKTKNEIKPLPNIEFNIRSGNSLVGFISKDELKQRFFSNGPSVNALSQHMAFFREHIPAVAKQAERILSRFDVDPIDLFNLRNQLVNKYRSIHNHELQTEYRAIIYELTESFNLELNNQFFGKIEQSLKSNNKLSDLKVNQLRKKFSELKPFHWIMEYSEIMENEGFDLIVENPPYIRAKSIDIYDKAVYKAINYQVIYGAYDIFILFFERSLKLFKSEGLFGIISSNKFFISDFAKKMRKMLVLDYKIKNIIDFSKIPSVFQGILVTTAITIIKNEKSTSDISIKSLSNKDELIKLEKISESIQNISDIIRDEESYIFNFKSETIAPIIEQIEDNSFKLEEIVGNENIRTGIMGFDYWKFDDYILDNNNEDEWIRIATNSYISPFKFLWGKKVRLYKKSFNNPYLNLNSPFLNENTKKLFLSKKVIVRGVAKKLTSVVDENGYGMLVAVHSIVPNEKCSAYFITGILNSKLLNWYHIIKYYSAKIPQGSLKYPVSFIKIIPVNFNNYKVIERLSKIIHFNYNEELIKLVDIIVYESYFSEVFKNEGIKTSIGAKIWSNIKDINDSHLEKKSNTIINDLTKNLQETEIKDEIRDIMEHPWIKLIEENKF